MTRVLFVCTIGGVALVGLFAAILWWLSDRVGDLEDDVEAIMEWRSEKECKGLAPEGGLPVFGSGRLREKEG